MSPRFSVLLPTHNRADVLALAIESILAQTEPDFEILVVGDGCTDDTAEVVRGFADARIRWFDLPKARFYGYANRNVALREARGDYIAFMAHDDLVTPDHLALLAAGLEREGAEWIYSRPLWISTDGVVVPFAVNLRNPVDLEIFLTRKNSLPASCVLHRRECLDRYGYWPEDVERAADWHYWRRIIQSGGCTNFAYCPIPTTLHFVADWKKARTSRMAAVATMLEIADANPWWPATLRMIVPEGVTEQSVFWSAMNDGGIDWLDRMRCDVGLVLDHIAWNSVTVVRPELAAAAADSKALQRSAGEIRADRDRLRSASEDACQRLRESLAEQARLQQALEQQAATQAAQVRRLEREYEKRLSAAALKVESVRAEQEQRFQHAQAALERAREEMVRHTAVRAEERRTLRAEIKRQSAEHIAQTATIQRECKERLNEAKLKRLRLEGNYRLLLEQARAEVGELTGSLAAVTNNPLWRATKPVRALLDFAHQRMRGHR